MPTTQKTKSVAPPATDKAAARPASAKKKSAPVAANRKPPMPLPLVKPAGKPEMAPAAKSVSGKLLKPKKLKLVRDSFTIPKLEYLMLDALKLRAGALGRSVKKNELVRAGIKILAAMPDSQFLAAVKALVPIKTSHPAKD